MPIKRVRSPHRAPFGGRSIPLEPVSARTMQQTVYEALRSQLARGAFEAGEPLKIQALAASLNTSTMPVREALARLVSERALEAMPNRSVRVPTLSRAQLEDLAATRPVVEGEAVRRALPHLDDGDLAELDTLTHAYEGAIEAAGDTLPATAADLNHAFHVRLYQAAGSSVLMPIIESLWLQSGPYIRAAADVFRRDAGPPRRATAHHRAIIDALKDGDEGRARAALAADIDFAFDLLRHHLPEEKTP